jgi:hypothetical protein
MQRHHVLWQNASSRAIHRRPRTAYSRARKLAQLALIGARLASEQKERSAPRPIINEFDFLSI